MSEPAPYLASRCAFPESIFFVGDSITLGWRDEALGGWPARLAGILRDEGKEITTYNLGVRGDTSREVAGRWRDEVRRRTRRDGSAAIVFSFGANDAKLRADGSWVAPIEQCRRNTDDILGAARAIGPVLFVGPASVDERTLQRALNPTGDAPLPSNAAIAAVSAAIGDEAGRHGVPFLDLMSRFASDAAWLSALQETDGIHPPARGHDLLGSLVGAWGPWRELVDG